MAAESRESAWEKLFDELNILSKISQQSYFDIHAEQIQKYKEPRLMCKVDFRESLPSIMSREGLSILAINNGTYRIAKNSPFVDISEQMSEKIETVKFPSNFISLDPYAISSESAALDVAKISGMIDAVCGEETSLSIRGRRYCSLNFSIGDINYPVSGVQVEVDGGYEGDKTINLIEAKIGGRNNINIRQLLYPQLFWQNQSKGRKEIHSYVFQYQNGLFRFMPFYYDGTNCSVAHSSERVFKISADYSAFDLLAIRLDPILTDLNVPFPQADDFEKVIAFFILIGQKAPCSKEVIGLEFDLVTRQIDYYLNVLRWMKLITIKDAEIRMTDLGIKLSGLQHISRMREFAKIVFSNEITHSLLHNPDSSISRDLRTKNGLREESTYLRRMATIRAWINYFHIFFE